MAKSQFEKRQSKVKESGDLVERVEAKIEDLKKAPEFSQTALSVFTEDGGKSYYVAEVSFNPESGEARMTDKFDVSRLVALKSINIQGALLSLSKRRGSKK